MKPVIPSLIISSAPKVLDDIDGFLAAAASNITLPKLSLVDGKTKKSQYPFNARE